MANKTDGDPNRQGGAYAPKGVKHPGGAKVPAKNARPVGGWPATVKTTEHGHYGRIARERRDKARAKAAA